MHWEDSCCLLSQVCPSRELFTTNYFTLHTVSRLSLGAVYELLSIFLQLLHLSVDITLIFVLFVFVQTEVNSVWHSDLLSFF